MVHSVCAFLVAQAVKNLLAFGRSGFDPWVRTIPWRTEQLPTPVFFPGESPWTEEPDALQAIRSQSRT